jgi:hypothetical protein
LNEAVSMPLPRIKFTVRRLLVLVAGVAIFLFAVDLTGGILWDGGFPLQIMLSSPTDRKIVRVDVLTAASLEHVPNPQAGSAWPDPDYEQIAWVEGQPFTVQITCSGVRTGLGRELRYSQFQLLILRVEFEDGITEWIHVKIPDGRFRRDVMVPIPERRRDS